MLDGAPRATRAVRGRRSAPPSTISAMPAPPAPPLRLYSRPGCHLCDQTRSYLETLLAERRAAGLPVPNVEERDITTKPEWEGSYLETIPVVELAGRELPLATSRARLRALLADVLDGAGPNG